MSATNKNETAKDACRTARRQIGRLLKMLESDLEDSMHDSSWPMAGNLGHVREQLAETVGFLRGVEGDEILAAMNR